MIKIDKKTAQTWSKMAKEQMENNWKIDVIVKAKVEKPVDVWAAVAKYIEKKITGYAKVTGNTTVTIDLSKIRKSIQANPNALLILGKEGYTIDTFIFKGLIENLTDNKFAVTELMSEDKLVIDWSK